MFAAQVASVLRSMGLDVVCSKHACTTPMVSFAVKYLGFESGVMITASHNPPHYNGYKIKEPFGGSATPEFVKEVERHIPPEAPPPAPDQGKDFTDLKTTSAGLFAEALRDTRIEVLSIRSYRDPLFGGHAPEPVERNLSILKEKVRAVGADLGIANDGDGDRIALVDERGTFVNTQLIFTILLIHLLRHRGMKEGAVVKTVSTTYLADRICKAEGVELKEVPVGFKNINEVILRERVIFGGEESGGYGIPAYLPERDGLLSGLLILEFMALTGKRLSEIVQDMAWGKKGRPHKHL